MNHLLTDARKALLAATAHTPAGSNAAALCKEAIDRLNEVLDAPPRETVHHLDGDIHNNDPVNLRIVDPSEIRTGARSRRCLEMKNNLHD